MPSCRAIALLVIPRATRRTTSCSRTVRWGEPASCRGGLLSAAGRTAVDQVEPVTRRSDGANQFVAGHGLEQVAGDSGGERRPHVVLVVVGTEDQTMTFGKSAAIRRASSMPLMVGSLMSTSTTSGQLRDDPEGRLAVARPRPRPVSLGFVEDATGSGAQQLVIVHHHHAPVWKTRWFGRLPAVLASRQDRGARLGSYRHRRFVSPPR